MIIARDNSDLWWKCSWQWYWRDHDNDMIMITLARIMFRTAFLNSTGWTIHLKSAPGRWSPPWPSKPEWQGRRTLLQKPAASTISGVHSNHTPFAPGTYSPPISYSHQAYSYPRQGDPLISQRFDVSHDVERFSQSFQYVLSPVTWCLGCIFHVSMSGPNLTTPLNIFQQHQKKIRNAGTLSVNGQTMSSSIVGSFFLLLEWKHHLRITST